MTDRDRWPMFDSTEWLACASAQAFEDYWPGDDVSSEFTAEAWVADGMPGLWSAYHLLVLDFVEQIREAKADFAAQGGEC